MILVVVALTLSFNAVFTSATTIRGVEDVASDQSTNDFGVASAGSPFANVDSRENNPIAERLSRRFKRQYYEEGYYGNYYWQTGRIIGWFLGLIIFLMILCVPCICCIGIWFAGWFGFRQAMRARNANHPQGNGGTLSSISYNHNPIGASPTPPLGGAVTTQYDTRVIRQQQIDDSAAAASANHLPRSVNVVYEDRYNDRYRSAQRRNNSPPPPIPPYHHGQRHRRDSAEESREYYRETRRL